MTSLQSANSPLLSLAVRIVTAYVSNNHVQPSDLPEALTSTYRALVTITASEKAAEEPPKATTRQIEQSITTDHLISFEDGRPYKTLRRHLALHGLTPETYRAKWGLSPDYPMTAPAYSEKRAALARALGLGLRHRPNYAASASAAGKKARIRRSGTE